MGYAELVAKLQSLPAEKQEEVFDFVEFLATRFAKADGASQPDEWSNVAFAGFSLAAALRDQADDPVSYSAEDLRERWK